MIVGIGLDLVKRERFAASIKKHGDRFIQRICTNSEQRYAESKGADPLHYAGLWAVKESLVKALGTGFTGGIGWHDIEVSHDALGKPMVTLSGKAKQVADAMGAETIFVSITHDTDWSVAQVILERAPG